MGQSQPKGSQYKAMHTNDGSLMERVSFFMETLAQRLKRDGLKLFLLVLANGLYLYIGGLIFYFLERNQILQIDSSKRVLDLVKLINLQLESEKLENGTFPRNLTYNQMAHFESVLDRYFEERLEASKPKWTVVNSVFFASTVVTTIGYGNLAPQSPAGRAFCVMYAVFGIPLTLILLAKVGKILAKYINEFCGLVVQSLRRYFYPDYNYESTDGETDLNAPVWLAMLLITIFLTFDAVVFMFMEHWSFGNSLYFIFITLTTIGFGDIVPQNSEAVWFNVTFLYIGLAAVSITINLFIANITIQFRRHKDKFKLVKHLESEFDSEADNETTPLTQDALSCSNDTSTLTRETSALTRETSTLARETSTFNCETPTTPRETGCTREEDESKPFHNRPTMSTEFTKSRSTNESFDMKPKRKTSRVRFQTDE